MRIYNTAIAGVKLITPRLYHDERGFFMEAWHIEKYRRALGIKNIFVQHNQSYSHFAALRGMHYQCQHVQGKLVRVVYGKVWDVVVDLRPNSATYGKWLAHTLVGVSATTSGTGSQQHTQLWVPPGMAHGFVVLSDEAYVEYSCTDVYSPADEVCLRWNCPSVGIQWPIEPRLVSDKDSQGMFLPEIERLGLLPVCT